MNRHISIMLAGSSLLALTTSLAIHAQAADDAKSVEEVVVTGTQIRGVAPVGAETIAITPAEITEAPGVKTNDVLATIPQLSFFNTQLGNAGGLGAFDGIESPQIHGLPTLIMIDGHRVASAGTNFTSIDPSIIPKGVLQGIEVVPDGGSSLYGSDAIGGVINFTTKKRFTGVDVDGDVSLIDGAKQYRANITAGTAWDKGSVYLGYAYDKQTPLYGRDRPYLTYHNSAPPPVVNTGCLPATVVVGGVYYNTTGIGANGKPTGYAAPAANCNPDTNGTVVAEEHQHSLFGGWSQDITQWLTADTRVFYSDRDSNQAYTIGSQNNPGVTVRNTNLYFTPVGAETSQTVGYSLTNNQPTPARSNLQTWGVSTTLTADLGHDFQARLMGNYSKSNYKTTRFDRDTVLEAASLASNNPATALDPYNPQANPQSALVASEIMGHFGTAKGQDKEYQARLVVDGPLFHLPAGDVKVAAGGEVFRESTNLFQTAVNYLGITDAGNPQAVNAARTVTSAFGEVNVPLISPDNHVAFVHRLDFSAAGRFDHYSDFGNTFNPRLAASYMPTEWLTLHGTWSHSFIAPSLYTEFQPGTATVQAGFPGFTLPAGDFADFLAGKVNIDLQGGNPNLKPEKSRTYTLGGTLQVPFIEGPKFSLDYYNTRYTANLLAATQSFNGTGALFTSPQYAQFVLANPTLAQAMAATAGLPIAGSFAGKAITSMAQLYALTQPLYLLNLGYGNNPGLTYVSGLDFSVSYRYPTSFGALHFSAGGNLSLENKSNLFPGAAFTDNISQTNAPLFRGTVTAGADVGSSFRGTATLLHTSGYPLPVGGSWAGQTKVASYNVVNTFFSYTLHREGIADGLELRFSIQNLFDVRPVTDLASGNSRGLDGQSLLGRYYELGFHKKF